MGRDIGEGRRYSIALATDGPCAPLSPLAILHSSHLAVSPRQTFRPLLFRWDMINFLLPECLRKALPYPRYAAPNTPNTSEESSSSSSEAPGCDRSRKAVSFEAIGHVAWSAKRLSWAQGGASLAGSPEGLR